MALLMEKYIDITQKKNKIWGTIPVLRNLISDEYEKN